MNLRTRHTPSPVGVFPHVRVFSSLLRAQTGRKEAVAVQLRAHPGVAPSTGDMSPYAKKMADYRSGRRKTRPRLKLSVLVSFIRQPFCVAFRIAGHPGTGPSSLVGRDTGNGGVLVAMAQHWIQKQLLRNFLFVGPPAQFTRDLVPAN